MKNLRLFWLLVLAVLLSACASTSSQQGKVERITPDELAKLVPAPIATITLDEIVADSKAGKTPDAIIEKIKTSNSRYELTPAQLIDLNKQGVDVKVLDYIQESNEKAKQNALADEMNRREQEKRAAIKQLQLERLHTYPYYGPYGPPYFYPYGFAGRYWPGSRFGWGVGVGHPLWW